MEMEEVWQWAGEMGLVLDGGMRRLIELHIDILWQWNAKMNLTGLRSKEDVAEDLLLDSLAASAFFPESGRYLDVGSGAGFPAIPIKVVKPKLEAWLVDSNRKRISFLKEVARRLGLKDMAVIEGRIEAVPAPLQEAGYDRVTARALAKLPVMINWCAPMVKNGGTLVCFEGKDGIDGIRKAEKEIEASHLQVETVFRYTLPKKQTLRHIVALRKAIAA